MYKDGYSHDHPPAYTIGFVHVDHPTFTTQKNVNTAIAVAHARLANLFDPFIKTGLIGAAGFVVIGRGVEV